MNVDKSRNSNIELIRVVAMLGITMHHMILHSTIMKDPLSIYRLFAQFAILFGKGGVNLFVLITGFFLGGKLISGQALVKKVSSVWSEVFVYSVLAGGIGLFIFPKYFSVKILLKIVAPIFTKQYWFMTAYIGLLLMCPFFNIFLNNISLKSLKKLFCILIIMLCISPIDTWSSDLVWFLFVYMTGYLLAEGKNKLLKSSKFYFGEAFICFSLMWIVSIVLSLLSIKNVKFEKYINFLCGKQNLLLMYLASVTLFCGFISLKEKNHVHINKISRHTLASYLIQSNVVLSPILWNYVDIYRPHNYLYIVYVFGISILVVFIPIFIDFAIQHIYKLLAKCLFEISLKTYNTFKAAEFS